MRQDQNVAEGGAAILSGRDTTVNNGLTSDQMKQIIETVAAQVPVYAAIAREIVDSRLSEFEGRIIDRFETDSKAQPEAFKDPDFQYLLGKAQHAYARSGDGDVATALADLIVERSKSTQRNRLTLTLNQAVEVASTLTVNEFAELAFSFIFSRTRALGVSTLPALYQTLNERIDPYIDDISRSEASYSYLEAQRCANNGVLVTNFRDLLVGNYAGLLCKGFEKEELSVAVPNLDLGNSRLVLPSLHDSKKVQLNALDKATWDGVASDNGVSPDVRDAAWSFAERSFMTKEEVIDALLPHVPRIAEAFEVWEKTPIRSLQLTSVGIAIGHSYATKSGFKADLSIWIN